MGENLLFGKESEVENILLGAMSNFWKASLT